MKSGNFYPIEIIRMAARPQLGYYSAIKGILKLSNFLAGQSFAFSLLLPHLTWANIIYLPAPFFIALAVSDLTSGFAHWALDNYPAAYPTAEFLLGAPFVSQYLVHHPHPDDLTKYNFWETNSDGFFAAAMTMNIVCAYYVLCPGIWTDSSVIWLSFWITLLIWSAFTNQFHKWSHMSNPGYFALLLQKCRLIISQNEHRKHHRNHKVAYCLSTGWWNNLLDGSSFWYYMRNCISA